jgi:hypothetical protein
VNVERLHSILRELRTELQQTQQVSTVRALVTGLTNLANQPQQASHQQEVSQALTRLRDALPLAPSEEFSQGWRQTLEEIGVASLLGIALLDFVNETIEANQLTPTVAAETLEPVAAALEGLDVHLSQVLAGLEFFQVSTEGLAPGEVEVSVLIPRQAVNNELRELGLEILEIRKIIAPFQELITGSRSEIPVRSIASSDFGIFVETPVQVAAALAMSITWLMGRYKELLEIRKLRAELAVLNVPDEAAQGINDYADAMIDRAIEDEVGRLLISIERGGREHELRAEFTLTLRKIAERIDRGYNIDVRAEPEQADVDPEDSDDSEPPAETADQAAARLIREKAPELQFLRSSGPPLLSLTARRDGGNGDNSGN